MFSWSKNPLESNNLVPIPHLAVTTISFHFPQYIPHVVIPLNVLEKDHHINYHNDSMPLINIPHGTENLFFLRKDIYEILKKDGKFIYYMRDNKFGGTRTIKNRKGKKTRRSRQ